MKQMPTVMAAEWLTAREIAEARLPGMPATVQKINARAERDGWRGRRSADGEPLARKRKGRGGGWEYHISLLPQSAQLTLDIRETPITPTPMPVEPCGDIRWLILAEATRFATAQGLPQTRADSAFVDAFNARQIEFDASVYTNQRKLSVRTLQRWRSLFGKDTTSQPARRRPLLETARSGEVATFIAALIVKQPHLSADHVRTITMKEFGPTLDGKPLPSIRAFQSFIARWRSENAHVYLHLTNPDAFKNRARVAGLSRDTDLERLNQLWEIDASPADVLTTDGRYSLYVCIDLYSRRIIGLLSKTARADAVLALIRRAILAWGVPEIIRSDNGSDFKAHRVRLAISSLGIEHDLCPPFTPEKKGVVERAIGTIQRDLMPLLPGFIGHDVADRKQIEARKSFASRLGETPDRALCVELSANDVQDHLDRWAEDRYAHRPHAGLKGKTPFQAAANWRGKLRAIENERALDVLLAPVAGSNGIRTVGRQGVRVDGALFIASSILPGTKVLARCDPADMGRVWLFSPDGAEFLAEAICPERLGVDRAAAVAAARAEQARVIREEAEPIRRAARRIKPADMIEAVLSGDGSADKVVAFPRSREMYETDPIRAAAQSQRKSEDSVSSSTELPPEAQAAHERLLAEMASEAAASKVSRLKEAPEQRFRRALRLEQRLVGGEAVPADQARWLEGYRTTSEYRAHCRMLEDFGEEWLRAGER